MIFYNGEKIENYLEADEFVKSNFLLEKKMVSEKYNVWSVGGIFIEDSLQFEFVRRYWELAKSSGCSFTMPSKYVSGDFEGPDWYFCEESVTDYGMGAKEYAYRLESLGEKKRKFSEFCKKYDDLKGGKDHEEKH